MTDLPVIFNSKGALRDLSQMELANLAPDVQARYDALRAAFIENQKAEKYSRDVAAEVARVAKAVQQERLAAAKLKPMSEISAAKQWIATQRHINRIERGGR